MRCPVIVWLGVVLLAAVPPAGAEGELPSYSRPPAAEKALRAKDLPFVLYHDPRKWTIRPQRSQLELLARVVHEQGAVSGAFEYRADALTAAAAKEREIGELESAFARHTIEGFERRRVNGHEVLHMRARATTRDGQDVVIRSYLWFGEQGTADYGVVVNAERFDKFESAMMGLLNGFDFKQGFRQGDDG